MVGRVITLFVLMCLAVPAAQAQDGSAAVRQRIRHIRQCVRSCDSCLNVSPREARYKCFGQRHDCVSRCYGQ